MCTSNGLASGNFIFKSHKYLAALTCLMAHYCSCSLIILNINTKLYSDPDGNFMKVCIEDSDYILLNFHGPNNDSPAVYKELKEQLRNRQKG